VRIESAEERVAVGFVRSGKFVETHDNVGIPFNEIIKFRVTNDALT
jgi:hypothetical protein